MGHPQEGQTKSLGTRTVITPHHQIQQTSGAGMLEEEVSMHFFMVIDFLVRKLDLLKVAWQEKESRILNSV